MDQKQRLDYLVEKFKEDSGEYSNLAVPDSEPEKRRIFRSLMNIRMPRHLDDEVLEVQDAFLQEDARESRQTESLEPLGRIHQVRRFDRPLRSARRHEVVHDSRIPVQQ